MLSGWQPKRSRAKATSHRSTVRNNSIPNDEDPIILDTNILLELMRPAPNMRVVNWLNAEEPLGVTITAITVAEILYGIERLPDGKRKQRFAQIAAICQQHHAQLATRNDKDFEHLGIAIIDPWRVG